MQRCTPSSALLACPPHSRRRFKAWSVGFHQPKHHNQIQQKGQKGLRVQRVTCTGQLLPSSSTRTSLPTVTPRRSKQPKSKRGRRSPSRSDPPALRPGTSSGLSSGGESGGDSRPSSSRGSSHSVGSSTSDYGTHLNCNTATRFKDGDRGWDARRRDPRANGADIYVARFTKNGMGSAKPCWRCLEWCRWAGVKRVFHWNADVGSFEVVKVNDAQSGQYETHADIRLFAGMVRTYCQYPRHYQR